MTKGGDSIDTTLGSLGGETLEPPPLSPQLEAELGKLEPIKPRRPLRRFATYGVLSLLYGGALLWLVKLRPDLHGLSPVWVALYCGAWMAGFLALGWLALVPGRRKIIPNWRYAGIGAALAAVGYVVSGFIFNRGVPGISHLCNTDLIGTVTHGKPCLQLGLLTALVPVFVGTLLLRGSVPVGSRWVGAALGAAGGSLGGLVLHMHCHHADPVHLGAIHGGVVVAAAVLGALIIPRVSQP